MASHVDYEAAWVDLSEFIATTKPGYGQQELLTKMAELAAKHRLPEHFVHTVLRLYGGEVHLSIDTPETGAAPVVESSPTGAEKLPDPGPSTTQRSHDEHHAAPARTG